jgi:hypothetical protein
LVYYVVPSSTSIGNGLVASDYGVRIEARASESKTRLHARGIRHCGDSGLTSGTNTLTFATNLVLGVREVLLDATNRLAASGLDDGQECQNTSP